MHDSNPQHVEKWFLSLLQTAKRNADAKGIDIVSSQSNRNTIVYFDKSFHIDAIAYQRVLESYARSRMPSAPQKMEYLVGLLERHYSAATELFYNEFGMHQSSSTTTQNDSNSKRNIAAVIVRGLQPTVECYNSIIEAWGKDKDLISVVRSRRWLSKLEDDAKDAGGDYNNPMLYSPLHPNAQSYDFYLDSCSRGLGKDHKLHWERAKEAEQILMYRLSPEAPLAIRPSTDSFNYVLRAYTRCRKEMTVAQKVMDIVRMMERIQKEAILAEETGVDISGKERKKCTIAPNTKSYTIAIDAWIIKASIKAEKWRSEQMRINNANKQRNRGRNDGVQISINKTYACRSQDDGTKEMEKAATILKYISDLDAIGLADVRSTNIGYNTLLSGWARLSNELRQDIPFKSEKILHDMCNAEQGNLHAAPDVTSYNAVIKAWGRTKQANSADRCEYWLRKMTIVNQPNNIDLTPSPNVATYNLVMDAHLALGNASRVQDMMLEMMDTANDPPVSPNSESFSKVIRAYLNKELDKRNYGIPGEHLEIAFSWLKELVKREESGNSELGPAPDLFSTMLKTAAKTTARGENILDIAEWTFQALEASRFQTDYQALTWMLEVVLKEMPSSDDDEIRAELITQIFQQCCNDGILSSSFVTKLTTGPFYDTGWTKEVADQLCKELWGNPPSFNPAWSRELKEQENPHNYVRASQHHRQRPKDNSRHNNVRASQHHRQRPKDNSRQRTHHRTFRDLKDN